jgi:hypothetical protein
VPLNPFAFFLAIADKVHTALNLLDPTRTYAAADALWEDQRGAERLAEKEAEEEVAEPVRHCNPWNVECAECEREFSTCSGCGVYILDCTCAPVVRTPRPSGTRPRASGEAKEFDFHVHSADDVLAQMLTPMHPEPLIDPWADINERLNRVLAVFEAYARQQVDLAVSLLECIADGLLPPESSAAPASQTDAPGEASGVPEGVSTPDPDAPSGHLTLGNDPAAIHARALRKRLKEDRPRPTTCCAELHDGTDFCRAPAGHRGEHRGEVWAWD